ncbi:uncharacterized, partial [Tachysurus ichikawai]
MLFYYTMQLHVTDYEQDISSFQIT